MTTSDAGPVPHTSTAAASGSDAPTQGAAPIEDFFRQNYRHLVRVAYLGRPWMTVADAEDVVMKAFLKVLAGGAWERIEQPWHYLRKVISHVVVDEVRQHRLEHEGPLDGAEPTDPRAEEALNVWADEVWVEDLLSKLSGNQRLVMQHVYDQLTPNEVAALLGVTEATVRSHLRHARSKLRWRLAAFGDHRHTPTGEEQK